MAGERSLSTLFTVFVATCQRLSMSVTQCGPATSGQRRSVRGARLRIFWLLAWPSEVPRPTARRLIGRNLLFAAVCAAIMSPCAAMGMAAVAVAVLVRVRPTGTSDVVRPGGAAGWDLPGLATRSTECPDGAWCARRRSGRCGRPGCRPSRSSPGSSSSACSSSAQERVSADPVAGAGLFRHRPRHPSRARCTVRCCTSPGTTPLMTASRRPILSSSPSTRTGGSTPPETRCRTRPA